MIFITDDFLLGNEFSRRLYHDYAESMPIFDYHCHLDAKDIYENRPFRNLTELWLGGDHYKWRAERANGIEERLITGNASAYDKYIAFSTTLKYMPGNPLYHWSHLELYRYFGIRDVLDEFSAPIIWEKCQEHFSSGKLSPRYFIEKSGVTDIFTTDNPSADLSYHEKLQSDKSFSVSIRPAWRPDALIYIHKNTFIDEIEKLRVLTDIDISCFKELQDALVIRMDAFQKVGCVASDHSFLAMPYRPVSSEKADEIFKKKLSGKVLSEEECDEFRTMLMLFLAREYNKRGWVMELHLGCLRDQNARMVREIGEACGYDGIGDREQIEPLTMFFNELEKENQLPKTIIFNLNPKDSYTYAALAGSFQKAPCPSRIQYGTAWWMLDHIDGIEEQLRIFSSLGLLGRHIGMLTDSRSYVSYARHDYFRRILCRLLGNWIYEGLHPSDLETLGKLVRMISYTNAKNYFDGGCDEQSQSCYF